MKRLCFSTFFLVLFLYNSNGQWYQKNYNVANIDMMSLSQLQQALQSAKYNLILSATGIACGGALYYGGWYTLKNGLEEDATFIEQLLGSNFMGNTYKVLGVGCAAAGIISGIIFLGRIGTINSAIKRNFPLLNYMDIQPSLIRCELYGNSVPGVRLTFRF